MVPRLLGLSTAVPPFKLRQGDVMERAGALFDERTREDLARLLPVYANAGIETRYSCVPLEWYEESHGWAEKNRLYLDNAVTLMETAALDCLGGAGLEVTDVDTIISVSSSGIATPSLDALLAERVGMRRDLQRLPIFGLGCAGGVLGLARAAAMALALPGSKVLLTVVELCGLTFRRADQSNSNLVATALFGDGAAAALVSTDGDGPALASWGEHTWPGSLQVMGWRVEDDGFSVQFSREIPAIIRARFRPALDDFLGRQGLRLADIDHFLCHPGGAKVMDALEQVFGLSPGSLGLSRDVLREYGNMSAATIMFVLEKAMGEDGRSLLSALGPGFSAGFMIVEGA
ncbi:MAG: type III polyketide synthase [Proteobacteria bacterium]|nr:type III polyketide synthase [Pseudomonadota bacterium]